MKKIFFTLLTTLIATMGAWADEIVSGEYYKICTADGTKALSNGGNTNNNTILSMVALDDSDDGQLWKITASGEYWTIQSSLGAVNADNPAESHSKWSNKLLQWQTSGGNNQKWTFEAADDGTYYLIPYENSAKCYGYDTDGNFTFQDKTDASNQKLQLVKTKKPTVVVDGIESEAYYRICSLDGASALSNGASTANNRVVSLTAVDNSDEGQVWQITRSGNYWTITSSVGAVSLDNPSESHSKFSNQLIQWSTSGGNNQKWTFELVEEGVYYLIPYENSAKCYGYNDNGVFTFQDKTEADNQKLRLVKTTVPSPSKAIVNGYYAIQAISTFPDYNYAAEGKFISVNSNGTASLTTKYSYSNSRLQIATDEDGLASITLPQSELYLYASESTFKGSANTNTVNEENNKFVFFMNTDELNLDTHVAIHTGDNTSASSSAAIRLLVPGTSGSSLTISSKKIENGYTFRLVSLPAQEDVDKLKVTIDEASTLLSSLSGDAATELRAAITTAQDELDYPYVTKKDVVTDVANLTEAIQKAQEQLNQSAQKENGGLTGISSQQSSNISVSVVNKCIVVKNAQSYSVFNAAGQVQPHDKPLPVGTYIVVADGENVKVNVN